VAELQKEHKFFSDEIGPSLLTKIELTVVRMTKQTQKQLIN